MKVGIDISQVAYQGTGVSTYTRSLLEAFLKVDKDDEFVLFGSSFRNTKILREYLKYLKTEGNNFKKKIYHFPPKILELLWNGIHLVPIETFVGEVDIFHSSDWLEPPTRNAKRVTTIHDFAVYKYPETFSQRGGHDIVANQKRKNFFVKNYSDLIIAVSETTKKDAMEILKIPEKKIKVIYEAGGINFSRQNKETISKVKEKHKISGEYLLCVGTREPRKNLDRVLMAYAQIIQRYPDLSLVIAGKYGWGSDNSKLKIQGSKLEERVKLLGFVEEGDLACLYSGSEVFIYPSLYEGFGLPILDAMKCGAPVITSNIGSMKEISGGASLLVNPENVEEIAEAINKILKSSAIKSELIINGLKRSGDFSWEKTALQTLEAYRSLLK